MARKPGAPRNRNNPRRMWAESVTPLMTAARAGASQAARTAGRERARARPRPAWWRRRWLLIGMAGLGVGMAVAGAFARMAERERIAGQGGPATARIKSSMDSGRERFTGAARTMADKVRAGNGAGTGPAAMAGATQDRSKGQTPTTGSGYGQPR